MKHMMCRRQRPSSFDIGVRTGALFVLLLTIFAIIPILQVGAECGDCFGAGEPGQCCNTCEDIASAYKKKKWKFHEKDFALCRESDAKKARPKLDAEEFKRLHTERREKEMEKEKKDKERQHAELQKKLARHNNDEATKQKKEEEIADRVQKAAEMKKKRQEEDAAKEKRQQDEAKRKAAEAKKKKETEEAAKQQQQKQKDQAEQKLAQEAKRKQQETERNLKAEEDRKRKAEQDARKRKEEEKRKRKAEADEAARKKKTAENDRRKEDESEKRAQEQADTAAAAAAGGGADTVVNRVKSKIQDKVEEVREHNPMVNKAATVVEEVVHTVAESQTGQAAAHTARDLYARASVETGRAVHGLADRVAPSVSAKYISESRYASIGGLIVLVVLISASLSICKCMVCRKSKLFVRRTRGKEKADLDYSPPSNVEEGGACLGNDDKGQPFQLFHEFEYTMRKRYQGNSYSHPSYSPPGQRSPPSSTSSKYTYRQHSYGKDGQPITVSTSVEEFKDKPIPRKRRGAKFLNGSGTRLLTTVFGAVAVLYVGRRYVMPAEMSVGDLWLMTAEFVDTRLLGHHGLVL